MKRSEMELEISKKLQKQEHMIAGYINGSISFKCLCDNLAGRVLTEIEESGMLPPTNIESQSIINGRRFRQLDLCFVDFKWEPEDDV